MKYTILFVLIYFCFSIVVFAEFPIDSISGESIGNMMLVTDENNDAIDISAYNTYLNLYESLPTGSYPTIPPDLQFTYDNSDDESDPTNGITVLRIRPYDYAGYFTEAWYETSTTDVKLAYFGDTTNANEYLNSESKDQTFNWSTGTTNYLYLGGSERFKFVDVDLETSGVGGTLSWSYWTGLAWSGLTVTDLDYGAKDFLYDGMFQITIPSNWAPKVLTEVTGQAWKSCYWIRCTSTTYTTNPKENTIRIGGIKSRTYSIRWVLFDGNTTKVIRQYNDKWIVRAN